MSSDPPTPLRTMAPLRVDGATRVAGVVGAPIQHSLSPLIHNAWIAAAGLDAVYIPLSPAPERFRDLVDALRGGSLAGLNVTLPFKEDAVRLADRADEAARLAGAANLLLFHPEGTVVARNTDGIGLIQAFAEQAPAWCPQGRPVLVLGAGGAARGAVVALQAAGAFVRVANRTYARARALAADFPGVEPMGLDDLKLAVKEVSAIVNATAAGLEGEGGVEPPWDEVGPTTVVMDMVYRPLRTPLLRQARARGHPVVDGLAMLIGQARPSFEALFGQPAPAGVDVRGLALAALGEEAA